MQKIVVQTKKDRFLLAPANLADPAMLRRLWPEDLEKLGVKELTIYDREHPRWIGTVDYLRELNDAERGQEAYDTPSGSPIWLGYYRARVGPWHQRISSAWVAKDGGVTITPTEFCRDPNLTDGGMTRYLVEGHGRVVYEDQGKVTVLRILPAMPVEVQNAKHKLANDPLARLVVADWLEETGRDEEAALVREGRWYEVWPWGSAS